MVLVGHHGVALLYSIFYRRVSRRQAEGSTVIIPCMSSQRLDFLVANSYCPATSWPAFFGEKRLANIMLWLSNTWNVKHTILVEKMLTVLESLTIVRSSLFVLVPAAVRHRGESRAAPCPRSLTSRFSTVLAERARKLGKVSLTRTMRWFYCPHTHTLCSWRY